MRPPILAMFALLCAAQLRGVPVTGELILPTDAPLGTFTLNGPNFSLTASVSSFGIDDDVCGTGCGPGDSVSPNTGFDWDLLRLDSVTVDGVSYSGSFGNISNFYVSVFFLAGPPIPITDTLVYTVPVTLDGQLIVYGGPGCVICSDPFEPIDPMEPPLPVPVTGSGQVTLTLQETTTGIPG